MKAIGTNVGFAFNLYRVSLSDPIEHRSGRGVIIATDDYSVPCPPGYAVRVTESPDYEAGEIVHLSTMAVRP
jgi:hypothetical protein